MADRVAQAGTNIGRNVKDTAQAYVPDAQAAEGMAVSVVNRTKEMMAPVVSTVSGYTGWMIGVSRELMERFPPLKCFVYTMAAASAVPVSVFLGYGAATGSVVLGVAGTIVTVVQGFILAIGAFFLFWWLLGAFAVACVTTFWFSGGYLVYSAYKRIQPTIQGAVQSAT
ncbi:hypothetical protein HK104_007283 [Borealophlyctis nickersoniae]|nr:hypothetical protein HK104_007283 [Borealophlyctis nickersoniae]